MGGLRRFRRTGLNIGPLARLFRALCHLYPGRQELQRLRPDLLGEALVATTLARAQHAGRQLLDHSLERTASETTRRHALTAMARSTGRYPDVYGLVTDTLIEHLANCAGAVIRVGLETGEPLPRAAAEAFEGLGHR